jgi:CRISPR/Cas system-associated endonuclease Cas3-HD
MFSKKIQKLIAGEFETWLSLSEKSLAPIRSYIRDMRDILAWWEQIISQPLTVAILHRDPFMLNKKFIQDYIAFLEQRVGNSTVLRKVSY